MFFQTEYQGLGVKWSVAGPGYVIAMVTNRHVLCLYM